MFKKSLLLAVVAVAGFAVAPSHADEESYCENPWQDSAEVQCRQGYVSAQAAGGSVQSNYGAAVDMTQASANQPYAARQTQTTQRQNAALAPVTTASIALQNPYRVNGLPQTRLDSFVYQAMKYTNKAEQIYGNEGTYGPPDAKSFATISDGGVVATTGTLVDAPSAWGEPMQYNQISGRAIAGSESHLGW